jgi:hypothetical protein
MFALGCGIGHSGGSRPTSHHPDMIVSKINSDVVLWSTAGQKPWLL